MKTNCISEKRGLKTQNVTYFSKRENYKKFNIYDGIMSVKNKDIYTSRKTEKQ